VSVIVLLYVHQSWYWFQTRIGFTRLLSSSWAYSRSLLGFWDPGPIHFSSASWANGTTDRKLSVCVHRWLWI